MSIITDTYYENKSVKKHIYMYYKKCVHVVIEIYKYGRLWETVKTYGKILQKMLPYK